MARILITDDEAGIREFVADSLRLDDHEVDEAADGREALTRLERRSYDREFVRQWWNWSEYLASEHPSEPRDFETFERILAELYDGCTFEWAASESGVDAETLREVADIVASAGNQLSTHNWRSASSGWTTTIPTRRVISSTGSSPTSSRASSRVSTAASTSPL